MRKRREIEVEANHPQCVQVVAAHLCLAGKRKGLEHDIFQLRYDLFFVVLQ